MHAHHLRQNSQDLEETCAPRGLALRQYTQHGALTEWFEARLLALLGVLLCNSLGYHHSGDVWDLNQLARRELQRFLSERQILYQMRARYKW